MPWFEVEYDSNNSGGSWWLSDEDWKALEEAGWDVDWVANDEYRQEYSPGGTRWLDALATRASKIVQAPSDDYAETLAITEFEYITKERADEQGCPCCGPPHCFYTSELETPNINWEELFKNTIREAKRTNINYEDVIDLVADVYYLED